MSGAEASNPIPARFASLLAAAPEAPVLLGSNSVCTRAGLDALASGLEQRIDTAGVTAPATCALAAVNGTAFLAFALAAWRRGLTVLLIDPSTPPAGRVQLARQFGAALLICCEEPWPQDAAAIAMQVLDETRALPGVHAIKLTSGSTGTPRGIAATAATLLADGEALTSAMGLTAGDRLVAAVPMSFAYGLGTLAIPALTLGMPLVVPDPGNPFEALRAARDCAATFLPTVPVFVQTLLQGEVTLPPSLRLVVSAGAPLLPATALAFHERFRLHVHVLYGASECGGITYDRVGGAAIRGTVGTPLVDTDLRIHSDDVLEVTSPRVASGYLPETDDRLGGGRFVTGDRVRMVDGELQLLGRVHAQIESGGRKFHPREVELVLARMPGVEDVVVDATADNGRCRAVIACRPGTLTRAQVMAWCGEHLAPFKLPRSVMFVREIPRTARGKIDVDGIARIAAQSS